MAGFISYRTELRALETRLRTLPSLASARASLVSSEARSTASTGVRVPDSSPSREASHLLTLRTISSWVSPSKLSVGTHPGLLTRPLAGPPQKSLLSPSPLRHHGTVTDTDRTPPPETEPATSPPAPSATAPAPPPAAELAATDRSRLRRKTERGSHQRDAVNAILDAGLICHMGFAVDGRPWVFPTTYARLGDDLYLHGAVGNFALRALADGVDACVTVTHLDGLVLARSAFHHSMNYRSVMVFGTASALTDAEEKRVALLAIVDHMAPGRSEDCRSPTAEELRSTLVLRLPLTEGSAKVRTGPPIDDEEDMDSPHWAGVLPLGLAPGTALADMSGPIPDYVSNWAQKRAAVFSA
jgi:uncharacterized protein